MQRDPKTNTSLEETQHLVTSMGSKCQASHLNSSEPLKTTENCYKMAENRSHLVLLLNFPIKAKCLHSN